MRAVVRVVCVESPARSCACGRHECVRVVIVACVGAALPRAIKPVVIVVLGTELSTM